MNKIFTILFTIILLTSALAQNKIINVNPDGTSVSEETGENPYVIKTNSLSPYHTSPSWFFQRDRQIGGMAFGDYDGDGDLDLAVGCYYSNSYPPINEYENFILRNDNGTLDTIPAWMTADERTTTDVKWADINGDKRIDLISANGSFQKSTIYFNSSTGLSTTPGWISNDNVWSVGAAVADVDGNGWLDLALGNQGVSPDPYRPIQIFFNDNGTLNTNPGWTSGDLMITNSVAFSDIDKSSLRTIDNLSYTANGTSSAFLIPNIPVFQIDSVKIDGVLNTNYCLDDINGWIQFGSVPPNGAAIEIAYKYISKGDMAAVKWSSFESGVYFNYDGALNNLPGWTNGNTDTQKGVAWADFDLDGYQDLAIGGNGNAHTIFRNVNGVLSTTPIWTSAGTNTSTQEIAVADVNRDGYPDLAAVHFGYKRIEIFFNIGGTLETTPSWTYVAGTSATSIAFGDVNGDGWLDLAVGTARSPIVLFIADPSLIPVELISFDAIVNGKDVILNWTTATEKNNSGFDIERKMENSRIWEKIGFVNGNGTSSEEHKYSFPDNRLSDGVYSYRLKQVDFDGTTSYSKIVEVEILSEISFELAQNYPNPFNPETVIEYDIPADEFVDIKVFDVLGNEVITIFSGMQKKGNHTIHFNGSDLNSGVYFYRISTDSGSRIRKMLLLK